MLMVFRNGLCSLVTSPTEFALETKKVSGAHLQLSVLSLVSPGPSDNRGGAQPHAKGDPDERLT